MDRATQWETLRPLIATGFIIWGWHSACWYWVYGLRLLIKDKVAFSSACAATHHLPGRSPYAPLKSTFTHVTACAGGAKSACFVTGDEAAIEQLVRLRQQHWLKQPHRADLRRQPSVTEKIHRAAQAASRTMRVMPSSLTLTPQISESDLRGLEKSANCWAAVWL